MIKHLGKNTTELHLKNVIILFSYETPVAVYSPELGFLKTEQKFSRTTSSHITKWIGATKRIPVTTVSQDKILEFL